MDFKSYIRRAVNHSTIESRHAKTTSKLAILETFFFILIMWYLVVYFDAKWFLFYSLIIASLSLFKSDSSTTLAIQWFTFSLDKDCVYYKTIPFWVLLFTVSLSLFFFSYFLYCGWLIKYKDLVLFGLIVFLVTGVILVANSGVKLVGVIMGSGYHQTIISKIANFGVLCAIVGILSNITNSKVNEIIAGIIFGILVGLILLYIEQTSNNKFVKLFLQTIIAIFMPLSASIILLYSVIIKIISTSVFLIIRPKEVLFNVTSNYYEHITINDSYYSPELLPSISQVNPKYQLYGIWQLRKSKKLMERILSYILAPIWATTYLYRWSIKSTAWFYFPMAYISDFNSLANLEKEGTAIAKQTLKDKFWINFLIFLFLGIYFGYYKHLEKIPSLSKYLSLISSLMEPIQNFIVTESIWLIVISTVVYFGIYYVLYRQDHIREKVPNYSLSSNKLLHWLIRLRVILWLIFIVWNLTVYVKT